MQVHRHRVESINHIYFNANVTNNNDKNYRQAEFDQTRTDNIIDNPSEYYMSVARFELPGHYIPVHIMPIDETQSDPNKSVYSVTLEYDGTISQQFVQFVTTAKNVAVPPDPSLNGQDLSTDYYFVYTYQHMVDMINTAFAAAFAAIGPPADSEQPFLYFNPENKLFTLTVDTDYYDINLTAPIKVFMNTKLYFLFQGFYADDFNANNNEGSTTDGKDVQFHIDYNNPYSSNTSVWNMEQNYISTPNWNPFKRIVFVASGMPITPEYVPDSDDAYQNILTDFRPDESSGEDVRSVYQYTPEFYRLIDLKGEAPLRRISFRVYWEDKQGNLYTLRIPYLQQASVKFVFIRKRAIYG